MGAHLTPTGRHKRIANRLRLVDARFKDITPERVRAVDVENDWQAGHPCDAAILSALDGRRQRKKP